VALKFREAIAQEFVRLVREGVPEAELPEIKEPELDATEETYASHCGLVPRLDHFVNFFLSKLN
jgi:hypothetical protein